MRQPTADYIGHLLEFFFKFVRPNGHYSLHRAATPNPAKKCAKNHNKLQQAVIPDWMGSITLRGYITVCFSRSAAFWGGGQIVFNITKGKFPRHFIFSPLSFLPGPISGQIFHLVLSFCSSFI
jgi:hypothetical protein